MESKDKRRRYRGNTVTPWALLLALAFTAVSLANLRRYPPVYVDEVWILSIGHKLFSEGVFGSDPFSGFHGMERHFLHFMPLMSIVQGATARVLGPSLLQIRVAPVVLGVATLWLTFVIARKLTTSGGGLVAMLLLACWQWAGAMPPMLNTGIPLVDVSRIGRYDILVAPLGLAAWWAWIRARETDARRFDFLSGLLAGLAGLAHLYGLFWSLTLILLLVCHSLTATRGRLLQSGWLFVAGAALPWLFWVVPVLANWEDFLGQMALNRSHFALLRADFYWNSLLNEVHRYALGLREPGSWLGPGLWLLVLGVPLAFLWLARRARQTRDARVLWLLLPCGLFPLLFALLVDTKRFNYLVTVAPLFSILLAAAFSRLLASGTRPQRWLAIAVMCLVLFQGSVSIARMQRQASRAAEPALLYDELKRLITPDRSILGDLPYWLAFPDRSYRFFFLPFLLSDPQKNARPIPFADAIGAIAPTIVLLDATTDAYFADRSEPARTALHAEFWAYMHRRQARLVHRIGNAGAGDVRVYRLE